MTDTLEPVAGTSLAGTSLESTAERVDRALTAVGRLDAEAKGAALELKEALEAFHRDPLIHLVRSLKADRRGKELLFELVDDPGVQALFALHGIIRPPVLLRAQQALDSVRPFLRSHGGDVELVSIEDGVAYVRLQGSCQGCSMSAVTLQEGVTEALVGKIAEIDRVEVRDEPSPAFIPLSSVTRRDRPVASEPGWTRGPRLDRIEPGSMVCVELDGHGVVITNVANRVAVFRNACIHQGLSLEGGTLEDGFLQCPWHGFRFEASTGECVNAPGAQLTPLPARIDDGWVWVRTGD